MKNREAVSKTNPVKASDPFLSEIIIILLSFFRYLLSLLFGGGLFAVGV